MLALVLGAELGGVLGALFAIPIAGILNVYLGALYRARRGESAFVLPTQSEPTTLEHLPNLAEEITQMAEQERIGSRRQVPRQPAVKSSAAPTTPGTPPTP